jgi:hypothetical protein
MFTHGLMSSPAPLLLIRALFGCAVVVMMGYGTFEQVARNDAALGVGI